MPRQTTGLLLMGYGAPQGARDIGRYYTHIRHGREPTPQLLRELEGRYRAIGGTSPLSEISHRQAQALASALNATATDAPFEVFLGYKHTAPFIEDAVAAMRARGIAQAVALVLAPHYSGASVGQYHERAVRAAVGGPAIHPVRDWYRQPQFIDCWARRLRAVLARIPAAERERTATIFSAHSLPRRVLSGDPYQNQVTESARSIARAAALPDHHVAWQSAGRTADVWLGPDIRQLTRNLRELGSRTFIYCPIGFAAENLEVLYDNDIECRAVVEELGGRYLRPDMPNDDAQFIRGLRDAVLQVLAPQSVAVAAPGMS